MASHSFTMPSKVEAVMNIQVLLFFLTPISRTILRIKNLILTFHNIL